MAKRPTPKKRLPKSASRRRNAVYNQKQIKKLANKQNSPYAVVAEPKNKTAKSLKGITRVQA